MRYLSLDIETTGLDPETCQIIELAAIVADTEDNEILLEELQTYHVLVEHDLYYGEAYALAMNKEILAELADPNFTDIKKIYVEDLADHFSNWLIQVLPDTKITVAGKNVASFDNLFLRKLNNYDYLRFSHRMIDVGSMYWNPSKDSKVPDTKTICKMLRMPSSNHRALDDAKMVIQMIRLGGWRHFEFFQEQSDA